MSEFVAERQRTSWQKTSQRLGVLKSVALGAIVPLVILTVWQLAATSGLFSVTQLPAPADVLWAAGDLAGRGVLFGHIAISVQRVVLGFLIGSSIALILGSMVGLSGRVAEILMPTIGALRAVPSLAWVPLLLIWMGIYEEPKITLVAIGAFFPVFTTVASGFAAVDWKLLEVGRAYGLRGIKLATSIFIPAAAPTIFSGLRLGLAQSWLFLVAAELIASSQGLGFLLLDSQNTARTDILFMAIIVLAVLGKLSDVLVGVVERRALRWL
jgi:sulfonate transport system permease protein